MSAETSTWAWEQDLPTGEKFLLVTLTEVCMGVGFGVTYGSGLQEMTGMPQRTVRRHLATLEEKGLLRRFGVFAQSGARREGTAVLLRSPGALSDTEAQEMLTAVAELSRSLEPWPNLTEEREDGSLEPWPNGDLDASPRAPTRDRASTTSIPSRTARKADRTLVFSLADDPDEEIALDGQTFLSARRKVGTQIVTAQEMRMAVICMTEFNRQAGTDQSLGPNLVPIVGRVREHPSWDAAKYVRLIQSAFRLRWWEKNGRRRPGQPTPKVIFGSTDCFVNVANDAADEAAGRTEEIAERRGRYDRSVVRDA